LQIIRRNVKNTIYSVLASAQLETLQHFDEFKYFLARFVHHETIHEYSKHFSSKMFA